MMKNAFYFILKALSVIKIFKVFVTTFWPSRKNDLIRRIRLISSEPSLQTIAIYILLNISKSKGNQTMKLGQLIEYNKRFFFKNCAENEARRLVPDLFKKKTKTKSLR